MTLLTEPILRRANEGNFAALGQVMFDAVRTGPSAYTDGQRAAWVPVPRSGDAWNRRLAAQDVIVAELSGNLVGFMSLTRGGYLDFAYICPPARGRGLFRLMLNLLEQEARSRGLRALTSHVSMNAEPAFYAAGFVVHARETVIIGDEHLNRCEMEKHL